MQVGHLPYMSMLSSTQTLFTLGYGNVQGQVGKSNADRPAFRPVIYDYSAPKGSRFSTQGMPKSSIARMYHRYALTRG